MTRGTGTGTCKIQDMLHGHKKDDEHAHATPATATTTNVGTAEAGYSDPATTHHEEGKEKKGFLGLGGHKKEGEEGKKHGFMGMGGGSSSSSSSDEEREGAAERNRLRREKRAQRTAGKTAAGTVPVEGTGEKKHGFFG